MGIRFRARTILAAALLVSLGHAPQVRAAACDAPTAACPAIAALLSEREGFGRAATGGLDGRYATVTSDADAGPGTLRDALAHASQPLWIRFASDMVIELHAQLRVPSNVTIDGRGRHVTIEDYGLDVVGVRNVILTHLTIDGRFRYVAHALDVANAAQTVWVDHLTLRQFVDRLLNIKNGATDVTASWLKFEKHNKAMLLDNLTEDDLFAHYDRDVKVRATLHHSYFVDTVQRNPRAQIGSIHLFNNLLENWDFYGMSFSLEAKALVEGNIFSNSVSRPCTEPKSFQTVEGIDANYCKSIPKAAALTALPNGGADEDHYKRTMDKYHYTHDFHAFIRARDNLYLKDAKPALTDYQPEKVFTPPYCSSYEEPSEDLARKIRTFAGNVDGTPERPRATCPPGIRD